LRLRQPDAARLQALRGQREFRYVEVSTRNEPGPLATLWDRIKRAIFDWLNSRSYSHFWRWVFYAVLLAAAVFVVLKLAQVELTGLFGRAPRRAALAYDTASEDIHAVDFTTRVAEAEAAGNYRLAVRLGYLQLLKALTDAGLINWQPDKTNHAYLRELPSDALRTPFREITRQFEYVWYGELALSARLYEQVRTEHRALLSQLTGSRRAA
jgi:hypothetical protein